MSGKSASEMHHPAAWWEAEPVGVPEEAAVGVEEDGDWVELFTDGES